MLCGVFPNLPHRTWQEMSKSVSCQYSHMLPNSLGNPDLTKVWTGKWKCEIQSSECLGQSVVWATLPQVFVDSVWSIGSKLIWYANLFDRGWWCQQERATSWRLHWDLHLYVIRPNACSKYLSNPRAAAQRPHARGGLFTDFTVYLYGGTSADLSKIPPLLGGIVICFRR